MRQPSTHRVRRGVRVACLAVAGAALAAGSQAATAATPIESEPFGAGWTPGTQWAVSGTYTPQVVTVGSPGAGAPATALRITDASVSKKGSITYTTPQPTIGGLDIRFVLSEWGGAGSPTGNGMSFFVRKGSDPSNAATTGGGGAGLGYVGIPGGLVGVGFDTYGGFPWRDTVNGADANANTCTVPASTTFQSNNVAIRGPGDSAGWDDGNGTTTYSKGNGYCLLPGANSANAWVVAGNPVGTPTLSFAGNGRGNGARAIRVTVDPSSAADPQIKVYYSATSAAGGLTQVISRSVPPALLAEPTFKFGFAAATGGATDNHEIWDLQVSSLVDIPPVDITTTSLPDGTVGAPYSCTTVAASNGVAPVTFGVSSGALPTGLTLNSATGEVCGTPTKSGASTFTVSATDSRLPTASTGTKAFSITVADSAPPCTPVGLAAVPGVGSAEVSWRPDGADACPGVTTYEVEASDGKTCTTTPPVEKCAFTDLTPDAPVRFRVRARNAIGASAWSDYTAPVVPQAKPSASTPSSVTVSGTPEQTRDAIVVLVSTKRAGMITLIGSSRENGRWFTRCVGRKRVDDAVVNTPVACRLTRGARRVLCVRPLRLRLLTRIATDGRPTDTATRYVRLAKRTCVGRVTG